MRYNIMTDIITRFKIDSASYNLYRKFLVNLNYIPDSVQDLSCTKRTVHVDGKEAIFTEHIVNVGLLDGSSISLILSKETSKGASPFKIEGVFFQNLGDFYHVKSVSTHMIENSDTEVISVDYDCYFESSCKNFSEGKFIFYDDFSKRGISPDQSMRQEFWLPYDGQWATVPSLMAYFSQRERGTVRVMETHTKKEENI